MKKFFLWTLLALFATSISSCSLSVHEGGIFDVEAEEPEMSFGLPSHFSRTNIGGDGRSNWAVGDQIALWAINSAGTTVVTGVPFTLRYYSEAWYSAIFTTKQLTESLAEDTYTYYGACPLPKALVGTKISYDIPSEQVANNFNAYDIVVAEKQEGAAPLKIEEVNRLDLQFYHKTHAIKIRIPANCNNANSPIKRIELTFPTNVTGYVTVDVADHTIPTTLAAGSNKLNIELANPIDEGRGEVYAFICPTTITGDVVMRAYDVNGYATQTKTIYMDKECKEGHITPFALTMPALENALIFSLGTNNLGESVNKFTVTTSNGLSKTFTTNSSNKYSWTFEGAFDSCGLKDLAGTTATISFESNNAIVSSTITIPSSLAAGLNYVPALTVPYLLFEDFSCIHTNYESYGNDSKSSGDERKQPGVLLNSYMSHSGWNAARFEINKGTCARINVRYQMVRIIISFTSTHRGRLDTPPLTGLKSGASVKVKVTWNAGSTTTHSTKGQYTQLNMTTHTTLSNPIDGVATGTRQDGEISSYGKNWFTKILADNYTTDSWTSTFPEFSATADAVTNGTRICFYPDTSYTSSGINNEEFWIYIDNIKVQIVQ